MTAGSLYGALRSCLDPSSRLAVVHSSLGLLRPPADQDRWRILAQLRRLVDDGWTIACPTFTLSFCGGKPYHWRESASETGILGQWLLGLDGAIRTPHPIYSFAVLGPLAAELKEAANSTTFGPDSVFARFFAHDAQLVMLGNDWFHCTQFHFHEEEARVPYRLYKDFTGQADFGDGPSETTARMLVRDFGLDPQPKSSFAAIEAGLRGQNLLREAPLWQGRVSVASCSDLADVCRRLLADDPYSFLGNARQTEYAVSLQRRKQQNPPFVAALLGAGNLSLIENGLVSALRRSMADRSVEVLVPPFGQALAAMADPGSDLNRRNADLICFVDRLEDLLGVFDLDGVSVERAEAAIERHAASIADLRRRHGGLFLVLRPARLVPGGGGLADPWRTRLEQLNRRLDEALAGLPDLYFIDLGDEAAAFAGKVWDPRLWLVGRFPFSDGFSRRLAERIAALAAAASGRSVRLLVLDLDNTLWGGVLGEDGLDGLRLGGDWPGNAFAAFQLALKSLGERGIALAVASKNDDDLAWNAIGTHPGMVLKPGDFAARRINWNNKAENVRQLCAELNLGPESVLFIDDNPAERESMRRNLPAVRVLDLPDDPAGYVDALRACPWLECLSVTAEDRQRVESYKARRQIEAARQSFSDQRQFWQSLGTTLTLDRLNDGNRERALQLLQKTNQFNATTRRHDRQALAHLESQGGMMVIIGAQDALSPFENIGLIVLTAVVDEPGWLEIDTYLLSCRILGRGVETGVLLWLAWAARRNGIKGLVGRIVATERNSVVRSVYADSGFTAQSEPGLWRLALDDDTIKAPFWLHVNDAGILGKPA